MRESDEPIEIPPEMHQFIERFGVYFEQYDLPRIGGRIIGLLIVAKRPLTSEQIASALMVSRASVSTNMRMAVDFGLAELVTYPGDRRDYYRYPENAWERGILVNIEATLALKRLAEQGLSVVSDGNVEGRQRLEDLVDFCDFSLDELHGWLGRWRERRAAREQRP